MYSPTSDLDWVTLLVSLLWFTYPIMLAISRHFGRPLSRVAPEGEAEGEEKTDYAKAKRALHGGFVTTRGFFVGFVELAIRCMVAIGFWMFIRANINETRHHAYYAKLFTVLTAFVEHGNFIFWRVAVYVWAGRVFVAAQIAFLMTAIIYGAWSTGDSKAQVYLLIGLGLELANVSAVVLYETVRWQMGTKDLIRIEANAAAALTSGKSSANAYRRM